MKRTIVEEWAAEQGICHSHARNLLNMAVVHGQATKRKIGGMNHYRIVDRLTKNTIGFVGITGTIEGDQ